MHHYPVYIQHSFSKLYGAFNAVQVFVGALDLHGPWVEVPACHPCLFQKGGFVLNTQDL